MKHEDILSVGPLLALAVTCVTMACGDDSPPGPLISPKAWTVVTNAARDPFDDRPADPSCPGGYKAEYLGKDFVTAINTATCDYVTLTQPLLSPITRGEVLQLRIWHFELRANGPAEAHAAVLIQPHAVWDRRIAIPSKSGLIAEKWTVPADVPEGASVFFHLHNHGANEWSLAELGRSEPE